MDKKENKTTKTQVVKVSLGAYTSHRVNLLMETMGKLVEAYNGLNIKKTKKFTLEHNLCFGGLMDVLAEMGNVYSSFVTTNEGFCTDGDVPIYYLTSYKPMVDGFPKIVYNMGGGDIETFDIITDKERYNYSVDEANGLLNFQFVEG